MTVSTKWDTPEYQRMASVDYRAGQLIVRFEDGSRVTVDAEQVLPPDARAVEWGDLSFTPYEIVVPEANGKVEVPWSTIRLLMDKEYSAHLAAVAEEQARLIGLRIKELRKSRNLSSKELAERAGITPQSLSRIEHGHHDVVFTTLQRLLAAMGYTLKDLAEPSREPASVDAVLRRLESAGIDREFASARLIGRRKLARPADDLGSTQTKSLVNDLIATLGRVFNWSVDVIVGDGPLTFDPAIAQAARFKVRGRLNELRATAYTAYAHFLAGAVVRATPHLETRAIPDGVHRLRADVLEAYGSLDFESLLRFTWDCGILVVPLRDPGAFHGACWRLGGRSVIVLKQVTDFQARWAYDLGHELKHVAIDLTDARQSIIEGGEISPFLSSNDSDEEWEASEFATDLLLFGRADELAQKCVEAARNSVEQLKRIVPSVSAAERVPVDSLANYLAWRLSRQGINWWGTANNLQETDPPPWRMARDLLMERVELDRLDTLDRELLLAAVTDPDEVR
jgi:transcriptional regulator with XRE-family HTH domain